jgi:CRISPR/Cas system-associated exonuclease Cas4 (RecB family)
VIDEEQSSERKSIKVLQKKKKIIIRASSIGSCRRHLWYRLEHGHPPEDPEFRQRLFNGVILHNALEEIVEHMPNVDIVMLDNKRLKATVASKKGWSVVVTGTPDVALKWKGCLIVVDFKGLSQWNIQTFENSDLTHHFKAQANAYAVMTGAVGALIAARSKESGQMKYAIQVTNEKKLRQTSESLIDKLGLASHPPIRDYAMNSFFCKWCPFRGECWMLSPRHLKKDSAELTEDQAKPLAKMMDVYAEAGAMIAKLTTIQSEIKRRITNLHDEVGVKTLHAGKGWSQVRHRHWQRLKFKDQGELDKIEARRMRSIKKAVREGRAEYVEGDTSYVVIS